MRTENLLGQVDALVIPGGESTTISKLLVANALVEPLQVLLSNQLPVFGTCAGMILLAGEILDGRPDQISFNAIDLSVRRNGYGRQVDSFEADLSVKGLDGPLRAAFIRAPLVERVGSSVDVLAEVDGAPVLCQAGNVLVSSFHPELTDDVRLHQLFVDQVIAAKPVECR